MDLKTILWYLVLSSLTVAYLVVLAGVRAAKSHDVSHHSHRMIVGCTIIGIWLVAYVLKQLLSGVTRFEARRLNTGRCMSRFLSPTCSSPSPP